MKITRMYGLAAVLVLHSLIFTGSHVYAAEVKPQKTVVKQQKKKKITHPCARKSAAQLNKRAKPFLNTMTIHSIRYEVDRDLIQSVITVESCYKVKARSPKDAQGLMQLIPATAERFGIRNAYNTYQNIKGGTRYLAWLSKRFDGDLEKVLAGYNAGEGRVERYNGIPPFRETRNYVHDVLAVYQKLKQHRQQDKTTAVAITKPAAAVKQTRPAQVVPVVRTQPAVKFTPQQRQLQARRQQLRQIQLRKQQQQRQAQLRQQQLLAQRRQQQAKQAASVVLVTGAPSRPVYSGGQQQQITIGQPPVRNAAAKPVAQQRQAAKPVARRAPGGRVQSTYRSPLSKPGRGGWQATRALAPQLFKQ